jgi:hypothetical protein
MTARQNRVFVARKLPTRVPDLIVAVRAIIAASKKNAAVKSSNPSMAKLGSLVDALQKAETAARSNTRGTAAARDVALSALRAGVTTFQGWVQEQADADPETAASFIATTGLRTRAPSTRRKAPFTATPGRVSGTLDVEVKAPAKRAGYVWEWSADGGQTWHRAPVTVQSRTTLKGLPVGKYVAVRWRAVTKTGEGDWSEPITVLVK